MPEWVYNQLWPLTSLCQNGFITSFDLLQACRVPEWAQNLMIRKPEQRKPEEIQHLKHLLMSMRSFREKYTDDMRTKMCEVVRYTRSVSASPLHRHHHRHLHFHNHSQPSTWRSKENSGSHRVVDQMIILSVFCCRCCCCCCGSVGGIRIVASLQQVKHAFWWSVIVVVAVWWK